MKARKRGSKEPFEEVEYVQLRDSYVIIKADQMEFENEGNIPTSIDWEQVRISAAIAAMQGMLSNPTRTGQYKRYAEVAIDYADALVEKLKEK